MKRKLEGNTERLAEPARLRLADTAAGVQPGAVQTPWFALRVRPNYEKPVSVALRGKGFEEFLPLFRSRRQWSDRVKVVDLPLFPGYLFCRLNLEERMPLLTTPGFLYIVGVGKNPEPVDESEILAIQSVVRSGIAATSGRRWPSYHWPDTPTASCRRLIWALAASTAPICCQASFM